MASTVLLRALTGFRGQRTVLEKTENYKKVGNIVCSSAMGHLTGDEAGGVRGAHDTRFFTAVPCSEAGVWAGGMERGERAEATCCVSR